MHTKLCPVCDETFQARRSDAETCTKPRCQKAHYRSKQRAEQPDRSFDRPRGTTPERRFSARLDGEHVSGGLRTGYDWTVDGRRLRWTTDADSRFRGGPTPDEVDAYLGLLAYSILAHDPPGCQATVDAFSRLVGPLPLRDEGTGPDTYDDGRRISGGPYPAWRRFASVSIDVARQREAVIERVRRDMLERVEQEARTLDEKIEVKVGKLEVAADKLGMQAHDVREQVAELAGLLRLRHGVGSEQARALEEAYAAPSK